MPDAKIVVRPYGSYGRAPQGYHVVLTDSSGIEVRLPHRGGRWRGKVISYGHRGAAKAAARSWSERTGIDWEVEE